MRTVCAVIPSGQVPLTLCVLGVQQAGKTSLCERYVNGEAVDDYTPSFIPAKYEKKVTIPSGDGSIDVSLTLKDALGNLAYERLLAAVFQDCQGALVVHDPTSQGRWDDMVQWITLLFNVAGDVPLVFAINKADRLPPGWEPDDEFLRTVRSFRSVHLLTSARTGQNVDEAFTRLMADVLVRRELERYNGVII